MSRRPAAILFGAWVTWVTWIALHTYVLPSRPLVVFDGSPRGGLPFLLDAIGRDARAIGAAPRVSGALRAADVGVH